MSVSQKVLDLFRLSFQVGSVQLNQDHEQIFAGEKFLSIPNIVKTLKLSMLFLLPQSLFCGIVDGSNSSLRS